MWFKIIDQTVELRIYAKPNARRSEITGVCAHGLGVALRAKPQDGAANIELIKFLSITFDLPKSKILLRRGDASRHKVVVLPLTEKIQEFLRCSESDR